MGYFNLLWISTGYTGAPGYTKLHFMANNVTSPTVPEVNAAAAAGRAFLASANAFYPTGVKYAFTNPAQWFNDEGVLQGELSASSVPPDITGTGGTNWPGGTGAVVYWNTGALNGGHRVKGRTYLVPLATSAFASDGTLQTTLVNSLTTAAGVFVGSTPAPAVNSRSLGQPDRGNATYIVTSATVKDRSAFLRTRRT